MATPEPIFVNLASESDDPGITELESLCMRCHGKGNTRLLLTKIPHYKEVIITSFECGSCGEKNNGIQTSSFQELGVKYELKVEKSEDLSRQIVKSDHATVIVPDLDFEKPADGEKGEITTVEGMIMKAVDGLNQGQEARKSAQFELYEKIQNFIVKLENLLKLLSPFTLIIDDPTGNSFIENLHAPKPDVQIKCTPYQRTRVQNQSLGLQEANDETTAQELGCLETVREEESDLKDEEPDLKDEEPDLKDEVLQFNTICDQCSRPSVTKMKVTKIPHFKEVVIMATECEACGHRSNEVKGGSGMEEKGRRHTVHVQSVEDLARDVLKSETCSIRIPEMEIDVGAGIFVGKFTTVEGLLCDIKDDLLTNPFLIGDATTEDKRDRMQELVKDIEKVIAGTTRIHLILDDPAGNSFVQDLYTPNKDPFLDAEDYERSFEQNEELGLNDMKTENYSQHN